MRYAILSDLHANLQAWQAVREDMRAAGVGGTICLGDVVGYGPCPAETLGRVCAQTDFMVIGNHDAAVCGLFDAELFNEEAQQMIEWTGRRLNRQAVEHLRKIPHVIKFDCDDFGVLCTHGALPEPEEFNYIFTEEEASGTWEACDERLVFVGHTHVPRVDVLTDHDEYACLPAEDFVIDGHNRYIVNVGSVGMPRTKDHRACYCILDTDTRTVHWRRVGYNVDALRADVDRRLRGVAARASILSAFDIDMTAPLREQLDFIPRERKRITVRKGARMRPVPYVDAFVVSQTRDRYRTTVLSAPGPLNADEKRRRRKKLGITLGASLGGIILFAIVAALCWKAPGGKQDRGRPASAAPAAPRTVSMVAPEPEKPVNDAGAPTLEASAALSYDEKERFEAEKLLYDTVDYAKTEAKPDPEEINTRLERVRRRAKGTELEDMALKARNAYRLGGADALMAAVSVGKTLIRMGAPWRYYVGGQDPGAAWKTSSFDDSSWKEGRGELGYGDGNEATDITAGLPANQKRPFAAYFRHTFSVTSPEKCLELRIRLVRDDGAVVYLNEREVMRSNMPDGPIVHTTPAVARMGNAREEKGYYSAAVPPDALQPGLNIVAVEVHQQSADSSDISFNLELIALVRTQDGGTDGAAGR